MAAPATAQDATVAPVDAVEAPEVALARSLFEEGAALARAQQWEEAAERFLRSQALVHRPATLFNLGVSFYTLARYVETIDALERYLATADPVADADGISDTGPMLTHARASVAQLVVDVEPPDANVSIDGRELAEGAERRVVLDPGDHDGRGRARRRSDARRHAPAGRIAPSSRHAPAAREATRLVRRDAGLA